MKSVSQQEHKAVSDNRSIFKPVQEIASRLGLPDASITHYGLNGDVNNVLMMADIVLYGSSQEIQSFPPLLIRAMSFGIPIMVPDLPALRNYVSLSEICSIM